MTPEQLALDWFDVCDTGADPYLAPDPIDHDLRGQGLTPYRPRA